MIIEEMTCEEIAEHLLDRHSKTGKTCAIVYEGIRSRDTHAFDTRMTGNCHKILYMSQMLFNDVVEVIRVAEEGT